MNVLLAAAAAVILWPKKKEGRELSLGLASSDARVDVEALELGDGAGRFVKLALGWSQAHTAAAILRAEAAALGLPASHVTPEMVGAYLDLTFAAPWNDRGYGTRGAASGDHVAPHGRTVRFVRCNANNRARLRRGLPPVRNVEEGERGRKARAVDAVFACELPYLWWPPLNRERFALGEVTVVGLAWDDGSSALDPPPFVTSLRWCDVEDVHGGQRHAS